MRPHRLTILGVAIIPIVAIALIIIGYRFDWTGFKGNNTSGKTIWDWLQSLIIPAIIALGAVLSFNSTNAQIILSVVKYRV